MKEGCDLFFEGGDLSCLSGIPLRVSYSIARPGGNEAVNRPIIHFYCYDVDLPTRSLIW